MARHIQGKDGKFAGSIGDGKTRTPKAAAPARTTKQSATATAQASGTDYDQLHAAFTAHTTTKPDPVVKTRFGPTTISTTEITDDTVMAYRAGQCFALADALARSRPGAHVGIVIDDTFKNHPWGTKVNDTTRTNSTVINEMRHAVCVDPDGTVTDIDGSRPMNEFINEHGAIRNPTLLLATPDQMRTMVSSMRTAFKQDYDTAAIVAELLTNEQ